jgi:hypothetical protein
MEEVLGWSPYKCFDGKHKAERRPSGKGSQNVAYFVYVETIPNNHPRPVRFLRQINPLAVY